MSNCEVCDINNELEHQIKLVKALTETVARQKEELKQQDDAIIKYDKFVDRLIKELEITKGMINKLVH